MKKLYKMILASRFTVNSRVRRGVAGLAILMGMSSPLAAQSSAYSFSQSNGTYTPITATVLGTATGNTSALNLNSVVYPVTIPFNFNYNGAQYSSMNVSTNGFITFGATPPVTTTTIPISATVAYDGAVSAFGRDLSGVFDVNGVTSSLSYETVGTAPNREMVVQWTHFRPVSSTSVTNVFTVSFQIRLVETTNVINMVYNNAGYVVGSTAVSGTAQIGLRGSSNADFNNRLNPTSVEFVNSAPGTSNTSSQAFHSLNAVPGMPSSGLTYSWTPPSCFAPVGLNAGSITPTGAQIQWSPSTVAGVTYDLYYSATGTPPTATTTPSIPNISGTSAMLSGLSPASNYYVWVRVNCGSTQSAWSLLNFATQCDILTGSYFEDFNGYTGTTNGNAGVLPNCWTNLGTTNGAHIANSASPTGSNTLYLWTSGTRIAYAALPPMSTLQSGTYKLGFEAFASVTANGILQIGYLDSSNNFVELTTFSVPTTATLYPFSYNLPALPAGVTQLAIKNPGTPANSLSIDNLSYQPQALSTSEVATERLSVYPNPFADVLSVSDISDVKSVTVTDASGRVIKIINKVSRELNLSNLSSGMYFVSLMMDDGSVQTFKVIKR